MDKVNKTEHHQTLSGLGFSFKDSDLPIINEYAGVWTITNPENTANNDWVVTTDGVGHNVSGHPSPAQIIDWAETTKGWQVAYVAPYGHYVEGRDDGIQLHEWLVEGRRRQKRQRDPVH